MRRWLRPIGILLALAALLAGGLAGLAWYLTTDSGFRIFVLPRVAKASGVEWAASHVEWHPLSSIVLQDVRIGTQAEPLLQAKRIEVRYHGREILRRNLEIELLVIDSPVLRVVSKETPPPAPSAAKTEVSTARHESRPDASVAALASLRIAKLSIQNLKLLYVLPKRTVAFSNLRLVATNVRREAEVAVEIETDCAFMPGADGKESAGSLPVTGHGKLVGQVGLNAAFRPQTMNGDLTLNSVDGVIAGESLRGLSASAHVDLSSSQTGMPMLKQGQVTVLRNGQPLAALNATGPLDITRGTMDLDLQTGPIQSNVLEILFISKNLDFEKSVVSYVGHVSVANDGDLLKSEGRFDADIQNVTSPQLPAGIWKPVTVKAEYNLECDRAQRRLVFNKLDLDARQQGKPLVQAVLDKPLLISWSESAAAASQVADTDFTVKVFSLDCGAWVPLLGLPPDWKSVAGAFDGAIQVGASNQGHNLNVDLHALVSRGACTSPVLKLTDSSTQLDGKVEIQNLKTVRTKAFFVKISEKNQPLLAATIAGALDLDAGTGTGTLQLDSPLPSLLALTTLTDLTLPAGDLHGEFDWKLRCGGKVESKSDLQVSNLSFGYKGVAYPQAALAFKGASRWDAGVLKIENGQATLSLAGQLAGAWQGDLTFDTRSRATRASFDLQNWRTPALAPLFAKWFPGRKLISAEFASRGEVRSSGGALALKAVAGIKKLAVEGAAPSTLPPVNATLSADLTCAPNGLCKIQSLAVQLDPTLTAKNLLQASGSIQQSPSFLQADLNIEGSTVDLTPYFDQLFPTAASAPAAVGSPSPAATASSPAAPLPSSAPPAAPPPPSPNRDIKLAIAIDSLKLREIVVTDLKAPFRMKGDVIELQETRFKINRAPVTARILPENGPPPTPYNIEIKLEGVPLEPFVDTFMPSVKEDVGGALTAGFTGRCSGATLADIRRNLAGDLTLAVRQARLHNLPSIQKLLVELSIVLVCPEIGKSTMEDVDASARVANEKLHTDNYHMKGSAVEATLRGDGYFDKRLEMEALLKIKKDVISRSSPLASLVATASKDQGDWIKLPIAASITGTTAEPKTSLDVSKLLGNTLLNTGIKILEKALQPRDPQSATNAPPSSDQSQPQEKKPSGGFLDNLFKGIFGK